MYIDKFSDRIDASIKISLYEYSIIRNPKTNKCIICYNTDRLNDNIIDSKNVIKPDIGVEYISFDDVKEALKEAEYTYFDFIDADRQEVINNLNNNNLTHHIFSLSRYNNAFILYR